MAGFTDPNTVQDATAGQPLQAARLDADRTALMYLATNKAHARIYNSANISINNNTRTALTFNSERIDVSAMHSTVSNTSRVTVPTGEGGMYFHSGHIEWAANATGQRNCEIRLNGTTLIAIDNVPSAGAAVNNEQSVATIYQEAAADYVELTVFQTSGGALNVQVAGNYSPELTAMWMCT